MRPASDRLDASAASPLVEPEALRTARSETVQRESLRTLRIGSLVVAGVMLIEGVGHLVKTPERLDLIAFPLVSTAVCGCLGWFAWRRRPRHAQWWFLLPWAVSLTTMVQHIAHAPTGAVMFLAAGLMVVAALVMGTGPLVIAFAATSVAFFYAVTLAFDAYQWLYPAVTLPLAGLILGVRRSALNEADRRRLAEGILVKQQAELDGLRRSRALAEGIAHHFNNLLMIILSHGSMALEDAPAKSELHGDLDAVVKAGQRATELVQRLVGTTGSGPTDIRRVTVTEVLGDALPVARDVTVVSELREPASLRADLVLLRAALAQVLENASEVTPLGQDIVLRVAPVDGVRVRFAVEDGGPGFSPDVLERAFEPFFTTRDPKRAGLGLAFAKGVVEQLGGVIDVAARPEGGAIVAFELPMDASPSR